MVKISVVSNHNQCILVVSVCVLVCESDFCVVAEIQDVGKDLCLLCLVFWKICLKSTRIPEKMMNKTGVGDRTCQEVFTEGKRNK